MCARDFANASFLAVASWAANLHTLCCFPGLVIITLVSEAEMFQPHELLGEPQEVAASHKHCLELAPAHIGVLAARGESWRALLNGRFVWSSAGVVGGCR